MPTFRSRPLDGKTRWPPSHASDGSEQTSLADVRPGEVVRITEIFFQMVRNRCWEAGIFEGDVVRCREVDRNLIVLVHPERRKVVLERSCARFVLASQTGPQNGSLEPRD